jgi:hypothetical protein
MEPIIRLVFHALICLGRLLTSITTTLSRESMTSQFCCLATVKMLHTFMSSLPSNLILLQESEFEFQEGQELSFLFVVKTASRADPASFQDKTAAA